MFTTRISMVSLALSSALFTGCDLLDYEFVVTNQFSQSFSRGEKIARKGDLELAIKESASYSGEQLFNYWDGVAHEFKWSKELSIPEVKTIIRQRFPMEIQDVFYDGLVIQMVLEHHGDPATVMPLIQQYLTEYALPIHNGLRIGFWRAFKKDFPQGVALANEYPQAYQPALFEEFGWWIGHSAASKPIEAWADWKMKMDESNHCIFAHGVLRGWMMHQLELGEPIQEISEPFFDLKECHAMAWRGLVWGAQIHYGEFAPEFRTWTDWLHTDHPEEEQSVQMTYRQHNLWD